MSDTSDTIIQQLTAAVSARKSSLTDLRSRIVDLLEPIPVGVVLSDDAGEVCRIIRVCTGASQWSNRTWDVTIKGWAALEPGGLLCESLDSSYWDGNNMHNRSTAPTCRYAHGEPGEELRRVPGSATRAAALRLPAAIARYIEQCAQEQAANQSTLDV